MPFARIFLRVSSDSSWFRLLATAGPAMRRRCHRRRRGRRRRRFREGGPGSRKSILTQKGRQADRPAGRLLISGAGMHNCRSLDLD